MLRKYHAFLSYNSSVYAEAVCIHDRLTSSGFSVFLDRMCVRPGSSVSEAIATALELSTSILILIGPNGEGPWQEIQNYAFQLIAATAAPDHPIIPVFLSRVLKTDDYPPFLNNYHDFPLRSSAEGDLRRLMPLISGEPVTREMERPAIRIDPKDLSTGARRFYEANEEIYLNRWQHGVPPEIYHWLYYVSR